VSYPTRNKPKITISQGALLADLEFDKAAPNSTGETPLLEKKCILAD
jgi:hypothetical protein